MGNPSTSGGVGGVNASSKTSQTMMGFGQTSGAIGALAGAFMNASAERAQGAVAQSLNEINADIAGVNANAATARGEAAARNLATRTKLQIGSSRASAAAGGVDVNSGSAAKVQEDIAGMSAIDQLTIKNNAMMEAFGFKISALSDKFQGKMSAMSGKAASTNTLLTGGMNAISYGMRAGYYFDGGH